MTIAELMAQPTIMEKRVSANSYLSLSCMTASPFPSKCWLWMTSECRKGLRGITTAPRTLMTTGPEPAGSEGTIQLWAA